MRLDLWEFVLHIIWVHRLDLLTRGSSEHFDDLDKLINATLAGEQGLAEHQLSHDASCRPDIYHLDKPQGERKIWCTWSRTDVCGVVGCAEDEFRSAIIPGTDIRDVGFTRNENLGRTEVAKLENASSGIEEEVLRFDISVTNANGVDVGEWAKKLIHVKFDLKHGHWLLEFCIMATSAIDCFWNIFENEIEIDFVFLEHPLEQSERTTERDMNAHLVAIWVEKRS